MPKQIPAKATPKKKPVKKTIKKPAVQMKAVVPAVKPQKPSEIAQEHWNGYLVRNIVNDFAKAPTYAKLTFLQSIPSDLVKFRNIGGTDFPYIPHEFSEKALNFVFNFNVNAEVISKDVRDGKTSKGKKFWDVMLEVKFTFYDHTNNREIVRTVFSGHKGYENPATTVADVYKSALSKAYTVVARQFGIGANVKYITKPKVKAPRGIKTTPLVIEKTVPITELEEKAYKEAESKPKSEPVKKSFAPKGKGVQF